MSAKGPVEIVPGVPHFLSLLGSKRVTVPMNLNVGGKTCVRFVGLGPIGDVAEIRQCGC